MVGILILTISTLAENSPIHEATDIWLSKEKHASKSLIPFAISTFVIPLLKNDSHSTISIYALSQVLQDLV